MRVERDRAWWLPVLALMALGVALRVGTFWFARMADDHHQLAMVEGDYGVARSPLDLYNFARSAPDDHRRLLDAGVFPWWTDKRFQIALMRPLASATLWLDHAIAPRSMAFAHAHSMLWWCAMFVSVAWVFRALLPRRAAMIAAALLAVDRTSVVPTAWVANRNSLLAVTFGALAWRALIRWDETGVRRHLALGVAMVSLSLLAGESAIAMSVWALSFILVGAAGSPGRRASALAAVVAPCGVFLAVWSALDYGARGSAFYIDPRHGGARWAQIASGRFVAMMAELWRGPAEGNPYASLIGSWWEPVLACVMTVCVVVAIVRAAPPLRRRLVALAVAVPLVVLPATSAPPHGRLLFTASVGVCALLASVGELMRGRASRALVGALLVVYGLVGAMRVWGETWLSAGLSRFERTIVTLPGVDPRRTPGLTFLIAGVADFPTAHGQMLLCRSRGFARPDAWRYLSFTSSPTMLVRTGERQLEMRALGGSVIDEMAVSGWRDPEHPLRAGDVVRVRGMTATVLELRGITPTRVRYDFARALDDPRMVILIGTTRGLEQVRAPPQNAGRLVEAGRPPYLGE